MCCRRRVCEFNDVVIARDWQFGNGFVDRGFNMTSFQRDIHEIQLHVINSWCRYINFILKFLIVVIRITAAERHRGSHRIIFETNKVVNLFETQSLLRSALESTLRRHQLAINNADRGFINGFWSNVKLYSDLRWFVVVQSSIDEPSKLSDVYKQKKVFAIFFLHLYWYQSEGYTNVIQNI